MPNLMRRHYRWWIGLLFILIAVGYGERFFREGTEQALAEYGFYSEEDWPGEKVRWTWQRASVRVKATSDLWGFKVFAAPWNSSGSEGLAVTLFLNGQFWDKVSFFNGGNRAIYYYEAGIEGKEMEVQLTVNRTFTPVRMRLNEDGRELGVAVTRVNFLKDMPKEGVGFYGWETGGKAMPGGQAGVPELFRWTGKRASMPLDGLGGSGSQEKGSAERSMLWGKVYLKCSHPDIQEEPVMVKISDQGRLLRTLRVKDHEWKSVAMGSGEVNEAKVLSFEVSRTWNPKAAGVSDDARDLGVAVAIHR